MDGKISFEVFSSKDAKKKIIKENKIKNMKQSVILYFFALALCCKSRFLHFFLHTEEHPHPNW